MLNDILISMILVCTMAFFHEFGHKIATGKDFVQFKSYFPIAIATYSFTLHKTWFEYFYYILSGWLFSLPIVIVAYFISPEWFFFSLILSVGYASLDFFLFFYNLWWVHYHNIPLNATIKDSTKENGLKRWRYK